jgi:hypothetical protein
MLSVLDIDFINLYASLEEMKPRSQKIFSTQQPFSSFFKWKIFKFQKLIDFAGFNCQNQGEKIAKFLYLV